MEIVVKYWALIVFAIGNITGIAAYIIKQHYAFKTFQEELKEQKERFQTEIREIKNGVDNNSKQLAVNIETFNNFYISIPSRERELESKIMLAMEKEIKVILLKALDQEVRQNENTNLLKNALMEVKHSVDLVKETLKENGLITTRLMNKLDKLEEERIEDLKEQARSIKHG